MVVINDTPYSTKKLESIIKKVYKKLSKNEGELPYIDKLQIIIESQPCGTYGYSGLAWVERTPQKIVLRLPDPTKKYGETATTVGTVALIVHELLHLYGYEHEDMDEDLLDDDNFVWEEKWTRKTFGKYLPLEKD